MKKTIPKFKNAQEEQAFWEVNDSTDYVDWSSAHAPVFPNLKPSTKSISLRLPESLLDHLKQIANKQDVPYQSLIKIYLAERINHELHVIV